jgi:hypothetical protein
MSVYIFFFDLSKNCLTPRRFIPNINSRITRRSGMSFDDKVLEIPQSLPMLPVRDIVVFPYMIIPLFVGRDASIRSVEELFQKIA